MDIKSEKAARSIRAGTSFVMCDNNAAII